MVKFIRLNPEADIHFKGIGMVLYHMSKENIYDPIILKRFESNLFKFKDLFTHRLAFGSFYGLLRMNLDNFYMLEFLEKELQRTIDKLSSN
jgi:hypothetical protein